MTIFEDSVVSETNNIIPFPLVDVPSNISAPVIARNNIQRNFYRWANINNWKSANVDTTYGPTNVLGGFSDLQASTAYVVYPDTIRFPSGVFSHYFPETMGIVRGFSLTPDFGGGFSGLLFNPINGAIRGVPTGTSSNTFRVQVTGTPGEPNNYYDDVTIVVYNTSSFPLVEYNQNYIGFTGIPLTITPVTWTIPGNTTGITVNPALPLGLTFTSTTGVVSGTPTIPVHKRAYQVRMFGAPDSYVSGSLYGDSFNLTISSVGYPSAVYPIAMSAFTLNVATNLTPTTWTNILSASISPTLPTGLSFTSSTGVISGTPTVLTQSLTYTVGFSGTAAGSAMDDSVCLSLAVSSPGNTNGGVFSAITFEVIPSDPNLQWDYTNPNFIANYTVIDYRGTTPSSIILTTGPSLYPARNIFKWILERCRAYKEVVLFRPGYYPEFNIGRKSNGWNDAWVSSGIRGVKLVASIPGSAIVQCPGGIGLYSQASTALNTYTFSAGAYRDLAFSGFVFKDTAYGNKGIFTNALAGQQWWPGLHFYNCTFDGTFKTKWLLRLYNMMDFRAINCVFKNNWNPINPITEHGAYLSTYAGNNFVTNCTFSGLGRNGLQLNSYKDVYSTTFDAPSGAWLVSGNSAIECGLSNWYVDPANPAQLKQGTNGAPHFTVAVTSAVWFLDNSVSSGWGFPVSGWTIPRSTGALVVWKNAFQASDTSTEPWPSLYGNKLFVMSGCNFSIRNGDRSLVEIKQTSTVYVYSGSYYSNNQPVLSFSSYISVCGVNGGGLATVGSGNIASTIISVALNNTTFPFGYPPYVLANCQDTHNCQTLNQSQFEALVTQSNPPVLPVPPTKPQDLTFLFSGGWTNPTTGAVVG